jgi:hypothetical protein
MHVDLASAAAPGAGADDDVAILGAGAQMDLPDNAVLNPDGSVTLTFVYPVTLRFMERAGAAVEVQTFEKLDLRRLNGADMRRIIEAPGARSGDVALARSAGMTQARLALLLQKIDALDLASARKVIMAMLQNDEGLPDRAEEQDDGSIVLTLLSPVVGPDGALIGELTMKRLTGADMTAIGTAKDTLPFAIHRTTGLTLKAVQDMFDELDGADVMAAQRVISFFSGSGRKTGR